MPQPHRAGPQGIFGPAPLILSVIALCNVVPLSAQEHGLQRLELVDSTCAPGSCRCRGIIDSTGSLAASGVDFRGFTRGIACLAADLDGNHVIDVTLAGGEGYAALVLRGRTSHFDIHIIDAGGVLELYAPRRAVGLHGEPPSAQYGLLVRNVGRYHVIFLWDGERFERTRLPAWPD